jgi:hypothetical protein
MPEEERVKVTMNLPVPLVRRVKHYAIDAEADVQDVVAEALRRFLDDRESRKRRT